MGMSQLLVRPRNRQIISAGFNQLVSAAVNGQFTFPSGFSNTNTTEINRAAMFPFAVNIEKIFCHLVGNALDDPSVTTISLRVNGVTTTRVLTLVFGTNDYVVEGFSEPVAANQVISMLVNSDSVGTANTRIIGYVFRAVVLG